MSARALRRLREEENDAILNINADDSDEEEYESEDDNQQAKRSQAFAFMMDDSSSSSSSSDEESENDDENDDEGDDDDDDEDKDEPPSSTKASKKSGVGKDAAATGEQPQQEEEDLDAILSEFQEEIKSSTEESNTKRVHVLEPTKYSIVLYNNEARDYDIENALRNMLHGTTHSDKSKKTNHNNTHKNRRNKTNLFARQRDAWGKKPSSYIGGGIGMQMTWLKDIPTSSTTTTTEINVPWPYCDETIVPRDIQQWYTFDRSSTYQDRIEDYHKYIANTGDINTLAMYIADNPFVVEPMFHFSMFFFSIGENDRGMELLKRILWVLESASLSSFLYGHENDKTIHLMDYWGDDDDDGDDNGGDKGDNKNQVFFSALFRLAQTSCMVGCVATSFAISRLLLSLDPMLDPCGVLLVLDYYALATMKEKDARFVVDLVEADAVKICDKDDESEDGHVCELREMPNWAFSYALAMYRISHYDDEDDDAKDKAKEALDYALARFPFMPRILLEKNGVNLKARSFQTDWPSVMGPLDEIDRLTTAGVEKISSIFVERSYKLWSGDDVLKWMYEGCQRLLAKQKHPDQDDDLEIKQPDGIDQRSSSIMQIHTPSPALQRYTDVDPMDFQDSFRRIPADANPLDPGLMDAALHYTPNRRRFLRMNRGGQGVRGNDGGIDLDMVGAQQPRTLLGTGREGMDVIDPDLPLLELFWRSLLPWVRVDGVPPPR